MSQLRVRKRKAIRALRAMARSLGIDPDDPRYRDHPSELWREISTMIAGGVQRTNEVIPGDPFCLFITGRCTKHRVPWEQTVVAKSTGGPIDEAEGKKIIAQLTARDDVKLCEQCGEEITTWTTQMTRMSVFRDAQREQHETMLHAMAAAREAKNDDD